MDDLYGIDCRFKGEADVEPTESRADGKNGHFALTSAQSHTFSSSSQGCASFRGSLGLLAIDTRQVGRYWRGRWGGKPGAIGA